MGNLGVLESLAMSKIADEVELREICESMTANPAWCKTWIRSVRVRELI